MTLLSVKNYFADDIFTIDLVTPFPGMPSWTNLNFRKKNSENHKIFYGPGIYAIFFEKYLIYIGKFLGKKGDPFAGDIREERWRKHLGTISIRDRNISFSPRTLEEIRKKNLSIFKAMDWSNEELVKFLTQDRIRSTPNRFSFGLQTGWCYKERISEKDLHNFQFLYLSLNKEDLNDIDVDNIRNLVSNAENELIKSFQPYCNSSTTLSSDPNNFKKYGVEEVANEIDLVFRRLIDQSVEPEESTESAFVNFYKKIDDLNNTKISAFALKLINQICEKYSYSKDLEVHFKMPKDPELRIRSFVSGRWKNIFLIKIQKDCFLCSALVSTQECFEIGISKPTKINSGALKSKFKYSFDGGAEMINKVIKQSIKRHQSPN
jgi:hypothetical protein